MTLAIIESAHDDTELVFSDIRHSRKGELRSFTVSIKRSDLRCAIEVDGYMSDGIPAYFADLDNLMKNFGGWKEPRRWSSLESEFTMAATADSLGHINIIVTLKSGHLNSDWTVQVGILVEAGQTSALVKSVQNAFQPSAT